MNGLEKRLVDAIFLRRSVRTYSPESLAKGVPMQLSEFFDAISVPFSHNVRLRMFEAEPGKGLYNTGVNPVNNLAFISQTDLLSISKMGFIGELVMLYAVSLGLSTCWFGHYKLSELGKYIPNIATKDRLQESFMGYGYGRHVDVGERVICCMPFGYKDKNSKRLVDFLADKHSVKRKQLIDLLDEPSLAENMPTDIKRILELGMLAPSAANSQMWRFGLVKDFKTITVAKPVGYRHFKWAHPDVDVGMCAAHIWLGLIDEGYEPEITVEMDVDRAFWSFKI